VVDGFSVAMAQAILLPAAMILVGVVAVLFLGRPKASGEAEWHAANAELAARGAADEGQRAAG
jgi:hypothetical protein